MLEIVLTPDELDDYEYEFLPTTYITQEDGDISVEFSRLDSSEYNSSSVGITENINGRKHEDDYDSREENWILTYEPTLAE